MHGLGAQSEFVVDGSVFGLDCRVLLVELAKFTRVLFDVVFERGNALLQGIALFGLGLELRFEFYEESSVDFV